MKNLYCESCHKETPHDHVRDLTTWYWRCSVCMKDEIEKFAYYTPTYLRKGRVSRKFAAQSEILRKAIIGE